MITLGFGNMRSISVQVCPPKAAFLTVYLTPCLKLEDIFKSSWCGFVYCVAFHAGGVKSWLSLTAAVLSPHRRSANGYERDHGEAHAGRKVPQRALHRAEGDHRRQREQGSLRLGQRVQVSERWAVTVEDAPARRFPQSSARIPTPR